MSGLPDLATWALDARRWLSGVLPLRDRRETKDRYAVFEAVGDDEMAELLAAAAAWQRTKLAAGYGAIGLATEVGGLGLPARYVQAFHAAEADHRTPPTTELVSVTVELVAPTIAVHGTPAQRTEWVLPLLAGDRWACQLFSEPDAGSDLASLACRADPVPGGWRITGQKVWTSGARFAHAGLLLARTSTSSLHGGITAFLLPLDRPGVEIRPIRQMSGGSTFNEVHIDHVEIGDDHRVGDIGGGWTVAKTALRFERAASGSGRDPGGGFAEALATARRVGSTADTAVRDQLAGLYAAEFVQSRYAAHVSALAVGGALTAEGSILKLLWVRSLLRTSAVASLLVGPHLTAEADADLYAWAEHVLGAPGYRIAGGTDEIQRNIIADRLLGLPRDPHPR